VRQVEARHRGTRPHGEVFGQFDADAGGGVEHLEQRGFFAVLGAGGVAGRGADALVFFRNQLVIAERFLAGVAPELAAHPQVQVLGEGFGQTVAQRLEQDRGIVVVRGLERAGALVLADAGGDDEGAQIVFQPARLGRDEVGEAQLARPSGFFISWRRLCQVINTLERDSSA